MTFADLALAQRIEGAHAQCAVAAVPAQARLNPFRKPAVLRVGGGLAAYLGPGSPINQAAGLGLSGPVTAADLDKLEAFYRDRGVMAQVEICPFADAALPDQLCRRGFRLTEITSVLVRPLPGDPLPAPPGGVTVEVVTADLVETWAKVLGFGFAEGQEPPPAMFEISRIFFEAEGVTGFLARIDGEPAGGGSLILKNGVATTNGAATLPAFRGRGVQTALFLARLDHAIKAGADVATTSTRPGTTSQRNAERLGFRLVWNRLNFVKDWPEPPKQK
jgi:GNAT superfamily N-acetyltransferase